MGLLGGDSNQTMSESQRIAKILAKQLLRGLSTDEERKGNIILWGVSEVNLYVGCSLLIAALVTPFAFHLFLRAFERDKLRAMRRRLNRLSASFSNRGFQDPERTVTADDLTATEVFLDDFRARAATPLGIALGMVIAESGLTALSIPERYPCRLAVNQILCVMLSFSQL
jgi:hypothetical protein